MNEKNRSSRVRTPPGEFSSSTKRGTAALDKAWHDEGTRVVAVVGNAGVGKSSMVKSWFEKLRRTENPTVSIYKSAARLSDISPARLIQLDADLASLHDFDSMTTSQAFDVFRDRVVENRSVLVIDNLNVLRDATVRDGEAARDQFDEQIRVLVNSFLDSGTDSLLVLIDREPYSMALHHPRCEVISVEPPTASELVLHLKQMGISGSNEAFSEFLRRNATTSPGDILRMARIYEGQRIDKALQSTLTVDESGQSAERTKDTEEPYVDRTGSPLILGGGLSNTDHLGRANIIDSLGTMLENQDQETPLNIALLGDWGIGKTNIMELLKEKLKSAKPCRFSFAHFNAWEYELTDNVSAGFAQAVVEGIITSTRMRKLPLWLSPLLWATFIRYVLRRHGERLFFTVLGLGATIFCFANVPNLASWAKENEAIVDILKAFDVEKFIEPTIHLSAFVCVVVLLFYFLKGLKEILEHPFAIGLKTYIKFPNFNRHLGLTPIIRKDIHALTSIHLGRGWIRRLVSYLIVVDARLRKSEKKWTRHVIPKVPLGDIFPRLGNWCKPRRLLVCVDDLDRCSAKCIAETLSAIRLIMDEKEVIVIVGIDYRIAVRAIDEFYKSKGDLGKRHDSIAREYLGKIFQLPICVRQPDPIELSTFISSRLFQYSDVSLDSLKKIAQQHWESYPVDNEIHVASAAGQWSSTEDDLHSGRSHYRPGLRSRSSSAIPSVSPVERLEDSGLITTDVVNELKVLQHAMTHTSTEATYFFHIANLCGLRNPRQLLRLRNSYGLLKLFDYFQNGPELDSSFKPLRLMRMLFVQEVLHSLPAADMKVTEMYIRFPSSITSEIAGHLRETGERLRRILETHPRVPTERARVGIETDDLSDYEVLARFVRQLVLPNYAIDLAEKPN